MVELLPGKGWATYLRVSNEDKQTPERSFAFQRQRIQENLLEGSGVPFSREYCDILTGTTPKRLDYQQMLADAEARKFSHLALYRADRFGRDALEGLQAATRLMSFGVKIRVAHMPSLCPETPDGFFMFMLQMGLAQREVEVMRQRISDGMDAKYRAGGWACKAPEGYVNKEEMIKSGKYFRWVEPDPVLGPVLREAWDLLLTGRYTMVQICDELTARGHTRSHARPWAWDNPKTGKRQYADHQLFRILHNPFYAGWVVSRKYGIVYGEVRGNWEPIITAEEYKQGLDILHQHDVQKSRVKRHHYLLRHLLWIELDGQRYRAFGSTPTGKSRPYAYYSTRDRQDGKQIFVQCDTIHMQIPQWLGNVTIAPDILQSIREIYTSQIQIARESNPNQKADELRQRLGQLREEEIHFARMLVTGKISEDAFDRVRLEWQEKVRNIEINIATVERESTKYLDDLDAALVLLSHVTEVYSRLDEKQCAALLQIIFKRIIVNTSGEIVSHELNSPFEYLWTTANRVTRSRKKKKSSSQNSFSSNDGIRKPLSGDYEGFLSKLKFEQRGRLNELGADFAGFQDSSSNGKRLESP